MNRKEYLDSLPKKFMAAGALFLNERKEVLIVHPSYKKDWEIPGGIVELNESPKAACEREIHEELGLVIKIEDLLCIDHSFTEENVENLQFVFFGGILSQDQINDIVLPDKELNSLEFIPFVTKEDKEKINQRPRLGKRLLHALKALEQNSTVYLERSEKVN
ncbi:NUDIX domain-containing protein [Patescibacteria group bacterium]